MKNIFIGLAIVCMVAGCATQKYESASVTFLHWNVSHFNDGSAEVATIQPEDGKKMAAKYTAFLDTVKADVIGVCEYESNFTTNGSMKAEKAVFNGYSRVPLDNKGQVSNSIFVRPSVATFADGHCTPFRQSFRSTAYYTAAKLMIGGTPVWFVETQLDRNTYVRGHTKDRSSQMSQIIEDFKVIERDFKNEQNVVIAGDFSVGIRLPGGECFPAPEEYDVFRKAGYELVNLYGTGTYPSINPIQPVDNIIVKGVGISEVRFLEANRLSDHMALSCKLSIYGKR